MSNNSRLQQLLRDWVYRNRRRPAARPRLQLEAIEDRIAPALLPAPTITDTRDIGNGLNPQAAIDPLNPLRMVVTAATYVNTNTHALDLYYSQDAGQTWTAIVNNGVVPTAFSSTLVLPDPLIITDPVLLTPPVAYPTVSSSSVAWGRDGMVYFTHLQHDATKSSGALLVHSFDMTGANPRLRDLDPGNNFRFSDGLASVPYRWAGGQDPALNPTIALDNSLPSYTDPLTGQVTQTDTMVDPATGAPKGVYVAWNTKFTAPSANLTPAGAVFNPNQIFVSASSDKGESFSGPLRVSDAGHFVLPTTLPFVSYGGPTVAFSPNGRLAFAWHNTAKDDPNTYDPAINLDMSWPDKGNPALGVVAAKELFGTGGTIPQATDPGGGAPHNEGKVVRTITIGAGDLSADFVSTTDLDATVAAFHGTATQMRVTLSGKSAGGVVFGTVTLVQNRLLNDGTTLPNYGNGLPPGLDTGEHLGVYGNDPGPFGAIGTVFDDRAPRIIYDSVNDPRRGQHYRPESGNMAVFNNLTRAQLVGSIWTLTVTDSRLDNPPQPAQFLSYWSLRFTSTMDENDFGGDQTVVTPAGFFAQAPPISHYMLAGATDAAAPTPSTASPTVGVGGSISIAFDRSAGQFSATSGRMYVGFTAALRITPAPFFDINKTDVFVVSSDDYDTLAPNWSDPVQLHDDAESDNVTEGIRAQFGPTLTVDPVTGTLVAMWYDARMDASNARVSSWVSTSIDGGLTWSSQGNYSGSFVDTPKVAVDAITQKGVILEPIPNNVSIATVNGFGRQSILAFGGRINAFWTGNENEAIQTTPFLIPTNIRTADVRTAAGARVVGGDMGPVTAAAVVGTSGSQITYNGTFAADGTRRLDGFRVVFDREIDASTFTPADVNVLYRSPAVGLADPATPLAIGAIELVDRLTYFVRFATPQSAVGTYSYSVGPFIADRMRNVLTAAPAVAGAAVTTPSADIPKAIANLATANSVLTLGALPAGQVIGHVRVTANITHPNVGDLRLWLVGPDGTRVLLMDRRGGTRNNINTFFDDTNRTPVSPFPTLNQEVRPEIGSIGATGSAVVSFGVTVNVPPPTFFEIGFRPEQPLSVFTGKGAGGQWRLEVEDADATPLQDGITPSTGTLNSWSLAVTPIFASTLNRPTPVSPFIRPPFSNTDNPPLNAPQASVDVPVAIPNPLIQPDPQPAVPVTVTSTLNVTNGLPAGTVLARVRVTVDIPHVRGSDLRVSLVHPDGTRVHLIGTPNPVTLGPPYTRAQLSGGISRGGVGTSFRNTTLDDFATDGLIAGQINRTTADLFTGTFRPEQSMLAAFMNKPITGVWTLEITDWNETTLADGVTASLGTLNSWSITLMPGDPLPQSGLLLGNFLDQDADSVPWEPQNDAFAAPTSTTALPFRLPYAADSLPLIIPGPTIVNTFVPGQKVRVVTATPEIGPNVTTNSLLVTFDRAVDPLTVDPNAVDFVSVTGPGGTVAGPFTVAPVYPANTIPYPGTPTRTFRLVLPTAPPAGAYTIVLGPDLQAADELALNSVADRVVVEFDRVIDPATFTGADVLKLTTTNGVLTTGFTVTPLYLGAPPAGTPTRRFLIGFPAQALSGQYAFELGANIATPTPVSPGVPTLLDTNRNAGLAVLTGNDPTSAFIDTRTYQTPLGPGVAINAGSTVSLPLDVADDFLIRQLLTADRSTSKLIQVRLNITHPNVPDLIADLVAPDGTRVRLFTQVGTFGAPPRANFINTLLDDYNDPDDGTDDTPIQLGAAPFDAGPYRPQLPLSSLLGRGSRGTWRLEVRNAGTQPGTLVNWLLVLPYAVPGTGLGEVQADRAAVGFRIFTQDPANPITRAAWTPVGAASESAIDHATDPATVNVRSNAGRVTAIAVDPTDPSGNTVYAGGASGGVWKTTNFLTQSALGPVWVPLTDFGPTNSLNVAHISVFPRNNDPAQTMVYVLTGEAVHAGLPASTPGVGLIRSLDGGRTWQVLDSTQNADPSTGQILPIDDPGRDHLFLGSSGHKLVIDPTPQPNNELLLYMAMNGSGAQEGVWRSADSGRSWVRIRAGRASDVALALGSIGSNGNREILYAAFIGEGVYFTPQATSATDMTRLDTPPGNALIRDVSFPPIGPSGGEVSVNNPTDTPNGTKGMIRLAVPTLTDSPVLNTFYAGWLYAVVSAPNGTFDGLFISRDFGESWTELDLSTTANGFATNNESRADTDPLAVSGLNRVVGQTGIGNRALSIVINPSNPNIVYVGGENRTIRVDTTVVKQAASYVYSDNSAANAGPAVQSATIGGVNIRDPLRGAPGVLIPPLNPDIYRDEIGRRQDFLNLQRDPFNPFLSPSSIQVLNANPFINDGTDVRWKPFNAILGGTRDVYEMFILPDPLTGQPRLIVGTAQGVYTGVDDGTGGLTAGIGFAAAVTGSRNGNLQIGQYYAGAVAPSQLAADLGRALFYATSDENGFPVSSANILSTGNIDWTSGAGITTLGQLPALGTGTGVATDILGTGTAYQYRLPCCYDGGTLPNPNLLPTDFFRVILPNGLADGSGLSRTFNLIPTGEDPGQEIGRWPLRGTAVGYFAVNPFLRQGMVVGASNGSVYRTTNLGVNWFEVANPAVTGSTSIARAVAYGAPRPVPPGTAETPDLLSNFIYFGTEAGRVFVTYSGSFTGPQGVTTWREISTGIAAGSRIMQIVANTRRGSNDAYLVTEDRVYYLADSRAATPTWQDITGNLFSLTRAIYPNPANPTAAEVVQALAARGLKTIAADWRYAIPVNPGDPNSETFPVLFVGGTGGVFRSKDQGATWTFYPDDSDGATIDGGWLANTTVTDLDLSVGDLDPVTGLPLRTPERFAGLNMLVATTYGRGTWAIRLGDQVPEFNTVFQKGPRVLNVFNPNPVNGPSNRLIVEFNTAVEPTSFDPSDVELRDTAGNLVTVTAVNLISTSPGPGLPNPRNRYEIVFTTQTVQGFYDLLIKPTLSDTSGNLMNQDNDNINGEPIEDRFTRAVFLNGETSNLVITNLAAAVTAGTATTFVVTARDGLGGVITTFTGTVRFTSSDPQAVLPADYTFQPGDAGMRAFTVEFRTAGVQTITASPAVGFGINPGSAQTTVSAAAATRLAMTGLPGTTVAGSTVPFTITAFDPFGNVATGFGGTVSFSTSDPNGTVPAAYTFTTADAGVKAFNATVLRTTGIRTVTATSGALTPAVGTIDVTAAAATRFELTGLPADVTAGIAASFIVTARDQFNNQATGYTGPVQFSGTDGRAGYPPVTTFAPADLGRKAFNVTFRTAGAQTLNVTHPTGTVTGTSGNTFVHPAGAFTYTLTVNPTTVISGGVVVASVVAFDQFGNQASEVNGPVFVTTTDGAATTPAAPVLVAGRGSFPITMRTAGTHAVTVTDAANPGVSATVGGITVIALRVGRYELTVNPTTVNIDGTVTLTVTAFDQFGNPASGLSGPVNIFVTDGAATLPVNPTLTNGFGTFQIQLRTPGTHTITVVDPTNAGVSASVGGITVLPKAPIDLPTVFAAGTDVGTLNRLRVYNFDRTQRSNVQPFDPGYFNGVRPAIARTPDGTLRVVAVPGTNWFGEMRVFDATTGVQIQSFPAFPESSFTGGMYVSTGDFNGDGFDDYVLTPDQGGGPRVRIVDGKDPTQQLANFFGIDDIDFRGGARTAVGDLNGDGVPDLVVAAGFSGGPRVAMYDGRTVLSNAPVKLRGDFFAFEDTLRNGVYVAVGDTTGDGKAELILGGGPGGGPRIRIADGASLLAAPGFGNLDEVQATVQIANFFAGDTENRGGVRVSVANIDNDDRADLIVGAGTGGGSRVTVFAGKDLVVSNPNPPELYTVDDPFAFPGGVFVG